MTIDFEAGAKRLAQAVGPNGAAIDNAVQVDATDLRFALAERDYILTANGMQADTIIALDAELERADRLITAMAEYVGKMALPAERLADLNEFWMFMERRRRAKA